MPKGIKAVFITALAGIVGIYLGAVINLEGYLGLIFSISTAAGFIVSEINHNK